MAHRIPASWWPNWALKFRISCWAPFLLAHLISALGGHSIKELLKHIHFEFFGSSLLLRLLSSTRVITASICVVCWLVGQLAVVLGHVVIGFNGWCTLWHPSATITSGGSCISTSSADHGITSRSFIWTDSAEVTGRPHGASRSSAVLPPSIVFSIGLFGWWVDIAVPVLPRLLKFMVLQVTRKTHNSRSSWSYRVSAFLDWGAFAIRINLLLNLDLMHRVETLPLVVHVDELFVDLADLAFGDGECLSIRKGFDGG